MQATLLHRKNSEGSAFMFSFMWYCLPSGPTLHRTILDLEENLYRRTIKEAIIISRGKSPVNRDVGQKLLPVVLQLVSHDIGHVTRLIQSTGEHSKMLPKCCAEKTKRSFCNCCKYRCTYIIPET